MKPRIFISAVTSELKTSRRLVADVLLRLGYDPVWQDVFGTEAGDLRQVLRQKMDQCEGLIHLVGRGYGAEPQNVDPDFGRVSFTQFEFLYALKRVKQTKARFKSWVIFIGDNCTRDLGIDEIDLPAESDGPHSLAYRSERQSLQQKWRDRLRTEGHVHYDASTDSELELRIERLKNDFDPLRNTFRRWQKQLLWATVVIILLLSAAHFGLTRIGNDVGTAAGEIKEVASNVSQLGQDVSTLPKATAAEVQKSTNEVVRNLFEDPHVLIGKLKSDIHQHADRMRADVRQNDPNNQELLTKIESDRDRKLNDAEALVEWIRKELANDSSNIYSEAAKILIERNVDEALSYLRSKKSQISSDIEKIKKRRDHADEELQETLKLRVLEADLLEIRMDWAAALKLRKQIATDAPSWFESRNRLGNILHSLGEYKESEPHKRAALDLAETPEEKGIALSNLAELMHDTNRLKEAETLSRDALTICEQSHEVTSHRALLRMNNLALVLKDLNELKDAESLLRRSLAIREAIYGPGEPEVAITLNNLAMLLKDTSRVAAAEPLMRRALAIEEQPSGLQNAKVARDLSNLAQVLQATNRLAEAEPLLRRALNIDENVWGSLHPRVADDLGNLGRLLQDMNLLTVSEPLMLRALAIHEKSNSTVDPNVASDLNNLAGLLRMTNRLSEAEPLMRRALLIDQESYPANHPRIATDLNNLAGLLRMTDRLSEAEPLLRAALSIDEESYGPENTQVAIRVNNLAEVLLSTGRYEEAEPLSRRMIEIFVRFQQASGHEHPYMRDGLVNYRQLLNQMSLSKAEIEKRISTTMRSNGPLPPIGPEVERLLGAAKSIAVVLATLDEEYKVEKKPELYFLAADQPMAPHLTQLLKPKPSIGGFLSTLLDPKSNELLEELRGIPLDEPLSMRLDEILGPAPSVQEVLDEIDRQYKTQGRPAVWVLPLTESISPHLDELLGPI